MCENPLGRSALRLVLLVLRLHPDKQRVGSSLYSDPGRWLVSRSTTELGLDHYSHYAGHMRQKTMLPKGGVESAQEGDVGLDEQQENAFFCRNICLWLAIAMGCCKLHHNSTPAWPFSQPEESRRMPCLLARPSGERVSCSPMKLRLNAANCVRKYCSLPVNPCATYSQGLDVAGGDGDDKVKLLSSRSMCRSSFRNGQRWKVWWMHLESCALKPRCTFVLTKEEPKERDQSAPFLKMESWSGKKKSLLSFLFRNVVADFIEWIPCVARHVIK